VESVIGTHLLNYSIDANFNLYYWRHSNYEVDLIIENSNKVIGLAIKSGHKQKTRGMDAFLKKYNPDKVYLIGETGISWQQFLKMNPSNLFS